MSYYSILGLEREPFSTSPDPAFFYSSEEHKAALLRLQIAISQRRGLSVIFGDVGTGKTTLSRKLSQVLRDDDSVSFRMVLNPHFDSKQQFLEHLANIFHIEEGPSSSSLDCMERIERFLFRKGIEENKTVVLLIDEAQILPDFALEMLRVLLNYETNEFKMLQLVLVGQMELLPRIRGMSNFWDRISLKYVLNPLAEGEIAQMINFRLRQAGHTARESLFSRKAIKMLSRHTHGYPRKLALMCHNALENLVMYGKKQVDVDIVGRLIAADREAEDLLLAQSGQLWDKQQSIFHGLDCGGAYGVPFDIPVGLNGKPKRFQKLRELVGFV